MTATKTEPTDEQLKAYADKLPEVYQALLRAYPFASRDRRARDPLSLSTLVGQAVQFGGLLRIQDLERAAAKLAERGFLEQVADGLAYAPTSLGERLITAVTGIVPQPEGVPELPEPTWG